MLFKLHSDQESDHLFNIQGQCERGTNCFACPTLIYKKNKIWLFLIQLKTGNAD